MGINLVNISKKFENKIIFDNVNISFNNCGLYLLEGRSGSGKTTLLNIISGYDKEDSGNYLLNGEEIDDRNKLSYYISYVLQDNNVLSNFTVLENIKLVTDDSNLALKYLDYVGLSDLVNTKANLLSSGEKLRLNIARELVKNTSIILLDEPTSSLDLESATIVMNILAKIAKDKLVIIASHDLDLVNKYNIKRIKIEPNINYIDNDTDIVLNEPINLKFKNKFCFKYLLNNIRKTPIKNVFSLWIIIICISVISIFLSVIFPTTKDFIYTFLRDNDINTITLTSNDYDDLVNKTKEEGYNFYYKAEVYILNFKTNLYVSEESFEGVRFSNAFNERYNTTYKSGDYISFYYDNEYSFEIIEVIDIKYSDNYYTFDLEQNYIIVSMDNFDISDFNKISIIANDLLDVLEFGATNNYYLYINELILLNNNYNYQNELYYGFIIVIGVFLIAFTTLFYLNFLIQEKNNIGFFRIIDFDNKNIFKLYSIIFIIYCLTIFIISIPISYLLMFIYNLIINNEVYNLLIPFRLNISCFILTIVILFILNIVIYLFKLRTYMKKSKISIIKSLF